MDMKRALVVVSGAALLGFVAYAYLSVPSDRELIRLALDESVQASREGRPGGVLEYLSKGLVYNEEPVGDRREISQFIQKSRPDILIEDPSPRIDGDRAVVDTPIDVKAAFGPLPFSVRLENVRITLAKETGVRWLVFPAPKWRITSVQTDSKELEGLSGWGGTGSF